MGLSDEPSRLTETEESVRVRTPGLSLITTPPLANAKNGKDCAQRAFDTKNRMMVRIDLILRIYHILGGFLWGWAGICYDGKKIRCVWKSKHLQIINGLRLHDLTVDFVEVSKENKTGGILMFYSQLDFAIWFNKGCCEIALSAFYSRHSEC